MKIPFILTLSATAPNQNQITVFPVFFTKTRNRAVLSKRVNIFRQKVTFNPRCDHFADF